MEKQFVTYEIALKLKELGFDEKCFGFWYVSQINNSCIELRHGMCIFKSTSIELSKYPKNVLAPLWQQVIDWFRDKHHTNIEINRFPNISKWGFVVTDMTIIPKQQTRKENINMSLKVADVRRFDEYFECREQAILKAIESCQK